MSDRTKPSITSPEGEPPADLVIDDEVVGDGDEATVGKRRDPATTGVAIPPRGRRAPCLLS